MEAPKPRPSAWDCAYCTEEIENFSCGPASDDHRPYPARAIWGHEWGAVAWMALEQYRRDYAESRLFEEIGEDAYHLLMSTLALGIIPPQPKVQCVVTVEVAG